MSKFCLKLQAISWGRKRGNLNSGCVKINMAAGLTLVLLVFVYLWQVNILATSGYKISEYEKKLEDLKVKNQELNIEFIDRQSAQNLQIKIKDLKMVQATDAQYLNPLGTAMAAR